MKIYINSKQLMLISGILIFILLIIITMQFFTFSHKYATQIVRLSSKIEEYNSSNIALEDDIRSINSSTNEVRRLLSLSERELSTHGFEKSSETTEESDDNLVFYNAVDYLLIHSDKTKMEINFYDLLNSNRLKTFLSVKKLHIMKIGLTSYRLDRSDDPYFFLEIDNPKNPVITIKNILDQKESFLLTEVNKNFSLIYTFIDTNIPVVAQYYKNHNYLMKQFTNLAVDSSLNNYFISEGLALSDLKTENTLNYYIISNKDSTFSMKISLDDSTLQFSIGSLEFSEYSNFYSALRKTLEESDKRTDEIRLVAFSRMKLELILVDEVFEAYLAQNNFIVKILPREDNYYFYYDIIDEDLNLVGSFAVQKIIGDIYLMDSEDIMISSLKYLESSKQIDEISSIAIPDNLPIIVDKFTNNDSTTFVVIGSHENNADTIILVHADGSRNKITLIAVPRDLYYQERKINDHYRLYGGEKFIEILSDITGLLISAYVAVDMYAFVDLINILGGIDIYLGFDLIDPTYAVRDNGKWSTLYYQKGNHHLNGLESLRIVRSRHTSSDFGRTSRQQLVIQSIKNKISSLDISDFGTFLKLFHTLKNYLDTNFSAIEMLGLFIKYKDTEVNRKQGLNTSNILYNTYTNIYKLKDKSKQYEENFYKGHWILLPHKDDWNVIKWYIRSLIEEN